MRSEWIEGVGQFPSERASFPRRRSAMLELRESIFDTDRLSSPPLKVDPLTEESLSPITSTTTTLMILVQSHQP